MLKQIFGVNLSTYSQWTILKKLQVENFYDLHEPMEAVGGYIECICGFPRTKEEYLNISYVQHIIKEYLLS